MKKRKIFFLIESLIVGGAEKVLVDIVNNLNPEKYDITVISVFKYSVYSDYNQKFDHPFNSHIHFKTLINNHNRPLYILFNFLLRRIPNLLFHFFLRTKFDIAVAFYEGLPTYWIGSTKLKDCKKMAWLHTSTRLSQKNKGLEDLKNEEIIYKSFQTVVAVSSDVANSFKKLFSKLPLPIVAYNPVDSQIVKQKANLSIVNKTNSRPILLTVGRITEAKGYKRWLEIVKKLVAKGYRFNVWIVGGGDNSLLKRFVHENELDSIVTFWGHQSNPYPFIKQADWVVCTSYYEGLSTVILESIILQKAILTTDCPGMRELLGNNEFGIIVANSQFGLQEGGETILSLPSLRDEYEKKVSLHPQNFELSKAIKHIESLFDA